ncbi:MAG: beta-hydroxyacyl-ACP dehydratase [Firmicutes bacterium]|nr:beta-hydroxyacyl-ACP dehydratase [Bacillota bacterium]
MNKQEIMEILPHRDKMLLVEEAEVEEVEGKDGEMKKVSHGKYHVRGDEFFLQGHFPGNPIVPGVILCEMMAQSTCVLLQDAMEEGMSSLFTGLKDVKFKNPVKPGDTFESTCEITRKMPPFYFAKGEGYVNGKLAVKAEFSFALIKA